MSHLNCDKNMGYFPKVFRQFVPQLIQIIVLPIFFFSFMLIYRPDGFDELIMHQMYGVHITIISCIILVSAIITRLIYYFLPSSFNYPLYIFWCLCEIIFTSFFVALYIWLIRGRDMMYLEVFGSSFRYLSLILIYPYVIYALCMRIYEAHRAAADPNENQLQRMKFYDDRHNLKIVLTPSSILYMASEENYVNIYYTENEKIRNYVLRSSMKSLEELCQENGLVRCHRSYYVNPSHIKVLRKDKEGVVFAELDANESLHIPVTKRYYSHLSELL